MKVTKMNTPIGPTPAHQNFKLGEGYGSGEKESDFQEHPSSQAQYGDNPAPNDGGGYEAAGDTQPETDEAEESLEQIPTPGKENDKRKKRHPKQSQ